MTTLHVFESDSVRRDVYVLCGRTVINTPSQTDEVCVVFICNLWSKYQRVLTQLVKITSRNSAIGTRGVGALKSARILRTHRVRRDYVEHGLPVR